MCVPLNVQTTTHVLVCVQCTYTCSTLSVYASELLCVCTVHVYNTPCVSSILPSN